MLKLVNESAQQVSKTEFRVSICRSESTENMWIQPANLGVAIPTSPGHCDWSLLLSPILGPVRTGILGGTFDPIHIAHLHAGETALHQAPLDRVLFIPAGRPWQKDKSGVMAAEHRLAMTRLAVEGVDGFEVDDQEVLRDGPTFTVDTLASFPDQEELLLILGADAASRIQTWRRFEDVLARTTVLVLPRPGTDSTTISSVIPDAVYLDMAVLEVSGTEIRNLARDGQPFRFLVTEPVHDYMLKNDLYPDRRQTPRVDDSTDVEEQS